MRAASAALNRLTSQNPARCAGHDDFAPIPLTESRSLRSRAKPDSAAINRFVVVSV